MIERVLDAARGRAEAADALWQRVERTEVGIESGRLKAAGGSEGTGVNLRVVRGGRVGVAGTTADDVGSLVTRALASAELGEALPLALPGPAPSRSVITHDRAAAEASLDTLIGIGRGLADRLSRDGCQVNVSVERAVAETVFANTAGAFGRYESSVVSVAGEVRRVAGNDVLFVYDYRTGVDLPSDAELDRLVRGITTRLDLALTVVDPPEGTLPVVFTPEGLSVVVTPLEQALSGKSVLQGVSPLAGRIGERIADPRVSITDDPLLDRRPGSRPFDDEGVPSAPLPLVADGVLRAFVYDLETAARAGARPTGHGQRGTFTKPGIGYTNLIFGTRDAGRGSGSLGGGLVAGVPDGLLVDDLIGVGQGNVISGAFSHPVALAYRVRAGEVVGRVKDAAVAGNVYELLGNIGGWGDDGRWVGSRWSPSLLLDGVSVARR
ncbi:MAG TPA: metallopeptidase TldD-related protein [Gemmatimonadales bacterium]|nr:metallopeptidase TldD-related protein [Gemmatimonadales bacterium]